MGTASCSEKKRERPISLKRREASCIDMTVTAGHETPLCNERIDQNVAAFTDVLARFNRR